MGYEKVGIPSQVYHLTKKKNLDSILSDQTIRRFGDTECWFCRSIPDMNRYMEMTVLCEGKPFVDVDGRIKRYPKFEPDDYVVLKLTPRDSIDKWYQWNQVLPPVCITRDKSRRKRILPAEGRLPWGYAIQGLRGLRDVASYESKHGTGSERRLWACSFYVR